MYTFLAAEGIKGIKNIMITRNGTMTFEAKDDDEIIARLKFIGRIEQDEKIDCRTISRQTNSWVTTIRRTIVAPDNRRQTLTFIQKTIDRSIEILERELRKPGVFSAINIYGDIVKVRQGLLNLKHTYQNDTKFCCDIDVLIEKTSAQLQKIRQSFPRIDSSSKPMVIPPSTSRNSSVTPSPMSEHFPESSESTADEIEEEFFDGKINVEQNSG